MLEFSHHRIQMLGKPRRENIGKTLQLCMNVWKIYKIHLGILNVDLHLSKMWKIDEIR